jgi:hypothetical protein
LKSSKPAGFALLFFSILALIGYAYLLLVSQWSEILLKLTILIIVGILATITAWIGYTIASAPDKT